MVTGQDSPQVLRLRVKQKLFFFSLFNTTKHRTIF